MEKRRRKKKKKALNRLNQEELKTCKYCQETLLPSSVSSLPKKYLKERYGVYWTGVEKPYIQINKISCPNLSCKKSYSYKYKGSTWIYK